MSKLYFVATKHDQYRDRGYEPNSVIIDPWRYIPDQAGSRVRRIGQNRPAMISVLVPSRGRPKALKEMAWSCFATATYPRQVEILVRLDEDDVELVEYQEWPRNAKTGKGGLPGTVLLGTGPRILLSKAWNELVPEAKGEILMHGGDDIVFSTPGWDQQVRDTFAASQDKILLVQGDDLSPNREALATHGFLHRRWVDTVGYFLPPLFSCDWNDVWLTDVADMIGRRVILPFVTEHRHYSFGKRDPDQTDAEREERGRQDDVVNLYKQTAKDREADAAKLRAVMA